MTEYTVKKCPKCGHQLRFPDHIGGMLMACPSCGNKFHSDFKLGGSKRTVHGGILLNVFEIPGKVLRRIGLFFTSWIDAGIDRHPFSGYVFIAGGIGIAPIMGMLRTLADRGDGRSLLSILFAFLQNHWWRRHHSGMVKNCMTRTG